MILNVVTPQCGLQKEMTKAKPSKISPELFNLKNVGPATYNDLRLLGIASIEQLASESPDELYLRLQKITGKTQDPCVWDIFSAIVYEARTGKKQPWWEWTKIRKKRSAFSDEANERRYWKIKEFSQVPCGGTHIKRTSEMGVIRLKRVNPGKGKERIEIFVG
jgi:hypothetical protein